MPYNTSFVSFTTPEELLNAADVFSMLRNASTDNVAELKTFYVERSKIITAEMFARIYECVNLPFVEEMEKAIRQKDKHSIEDLIYVYEDTAYLVYKLLKA